MKTPHLRPSLPTLLLGLSALLRFWLCAQGGRYYFADEVRPHRGIQLYRAPAVADFSGVATILAQPEHALFTWLGAVLSAAHHVLAGSNQLPAAQFSPGAPDTPHTCISVGAATRAFSPRW